MPALRAANAATSHDYDQTSPHLHLFRISLPKGSPELAFNSIANDSRLVKAHVQTSKICLLLLLNLLQIYYRFVSATIYDRAECRSCLVNVVGLGHSTICPHLTAAFTRLQDVQKRCHELASRARDKCPRECQFQCAHAGANAAPLRVVTLRRLFRLLKHSICLRRAAFSFSSPFFPLMQNKFWNFDMCTMYSIFPTTEVASLPTKGHLLT